MGAGDNVLVHSALGSVGFIEGGAEAVLNALLELISPGGTLVLPTFTYSVSTAPFDPRSAACRTGILPESARKRREAKRSLHPTHSITAIGPLADELTRDHLRGRAFGLHSALDRLARMHAGQVLLLGVNHTANSTIHVAEEHAGIPKSGPRDEQLVQVLLPEGTVIDHQLDSSPSCSAAFGSAEFPLRLHGLIRDGRVGNAKVQAMAGADVIRHVAQVLEEHRDVLLCTNPDCKSCARVRDNLRDGGDQ